MRIYATRDSVAAGDDCDAPHTRLYSASDDWTWETLVELALREARLPLIHGGLATWGLSSNFPFAVAAQQWRKPRLLFLMDSDRKRLDWNEGELRLHWSYFGQLNPNLVFDVLRDLRLQAIPES
jgi:hypothetical protein